MKPVKYAYINDAGWENYAESIATKPENIETYADCFTKLVPIIQQASIDYLADPSKADPIILDAVEQFDNGWVYTQGIADYGVKTMKADGLVANGPDDTVGNFDLDRVNDADREGDPDLHRPGPAAEGRPHRRGHRHQPVRRSLDRLLTRRPPGRHTTSEERPTHTSRALVAFRGRRPRRTRPSTGTRAVGVTAPTGVGVAPGPSRPPRRSIHTVRRPATRGGHVVVEEALGDVHVSRRVDTHGGQMARTARRSVHRPVCRRRRRWRGCGGRTGGRGARRSTRRIRRRRSTPRSVAPAGRGRRAPRRCRGTPASGAPSAAKSTSSSSVGARAEDPRRGRSGSGAGSPGTAPTGVAASLSDSASPYAPNTASVLASPALPIQPDSASVMPVSQSINVP